MSLEDLQRKLVLIPHTTKITDPVSGNIYFVLGQDPYYEKECKKRVTCGLGHRMWVDMFYNIICDNRKCQAKIKCKVLK